MIRKSIAIFCILFFCWSIFLKLYHYSVYQNPSQENLSIIETYRYDVDKVENVVVGSSLANRLRLKNQPKFYNLALQGKSVYDGLNIILLTQKIPKTVFIETNILIRAGNLNSETFDSSPVLIFLKKHFEALRADKFPLAAGEILVNSAREKYESKVADDFSQSELYIKRINMLKVEYDEKIDSALLSARLDTLKKQCNSLISKGVNIVFFEMPVQNDLENSNFVLETRKTVKERFPSISFLPLKKDSYKYITTDGEHLNINDAIHFTKQFLIAAEKISNTKEFAKK